jgi:uncharacterized delta-60 repeat protein
MQRGILFAYFFCGLFNSANAQARDSLFGIPTSLGSGGTVSGTTSCDFGGYDQAFLTVHLDDGRIILVGDTRLGGESDFAIARLMPDGRYDQILGPDGKVRIDLGYSNDSCLTASQYQSDWILMGGCVKQTSMAGYVNLIARIDLNGKLDSSFGNGGYLTIDLPTAPHEMITKIRPLPDGRIIIAGNTLYGSLDFSDSAGVFLGRLLSNGEVDSSFGVGGFVYPRWEPGCNASLLGDAITDDQERILLTGASYEPYLGSQEGTNNCTHNIFLFRYLSNGQADPNFGNNGSVELLYTARGRGNALLLYEDGRILLAGAAGDLLLPFPAYAFIARFMPDGAPDLSFGDNGRFKRGIITYGLSGGAVEPFGLLRMRDRVVVGVSNEITGDDPGFGAICLTEDGKIDSMFGNQGRFNAFPDLPLQSYINQISGSADNNFFLSGYTRLLQPNNMTIVKVRWDVVSNTIEQSLPNGLNIHPNPVQNGFFRIELSGMIANEENLQLKVRNINGRILYEQSKVTHYDIVETSQFPSGIYLVELTGQRSRYVGKFVVQNK